MRLLDRLVVRKVEKNRLETQLLEFKLLRESVAILPVLEREIAAKDEVIERNAERIGFLEAENQRLGEEMEEKTMKFEMEVGELRERENQLETQLLEFKLLKESVAILPVLKREIAVKDEAIERNAARIGFLEAENQRLGEEMEAKTVKFEMEVGELKRALEEFKSAKLKRNREELAEKEEISSSASKRLPSLDLAIKSLHSKKLKEPYFPENKENRKPECVNIISVEVEQNSDTEIETCSSSSSELMVLPSRTPRIPKPPPKPASSLSSTSSSSNGSLNNAANRAISAPPPPPPPPPRPIKTTAGGPRVALKGAGLPPPPPPPPPCPMKTTTGGPRVALKAAGLPPPPPPPPAMGKRVSPTKVRRVPEVVELYHSLMRRDSRKESGGGNRDGPAAANPKDMIGEIEKRSSYLLAIKTDVETQGDFIRSLITEVGNASFTDMKDVVPFVKWLDDELSYLVDERAVLKHFDWPEQKADALREAAFGYCDLKKIESEATNFRDDPRQPCSSALKKMQALFEKLEQGVYNLSRMRESATKRCNAFHIPTNWLLESGLASQIKLASVKLALKYMKRVSAELEHVGGSFEEEELMVQGVRFAFRVHQFAGGFDVETMKAFQDLSERTKSCSVRFQNQQQQKFVCRSTAC